MESWLKANLSICLGFEVPDDMINYILSLKSLVAIEEYFSTLLNVDCEEHRFFLTECKQRMFGKGTRTKLAADQMNRRAQRIQLEQEKQAQPKVPEPEPELVSCPRLQRGAKKKNKFVGFYANDVLVMKGRRKCECQATQHKLLNNCINCGRIVCEQEGAGPCLYCSEIVIAADQQTTSPSTESNGGKDGQSVKQTNDASLVKALEQRDRLLEYDRNSEQRTTVIDDELDYFQENSVWLTQEVRQKLDRLKTEMHETKHASRAQRKIKVDFAGRDVEDDLPISVEYERNLLKELAADTKVANNQSSNRQDSTSGAETTEDGNYSDPKIDGMRPIYKMTTKAKLRTHNAIAIDGLERVYNRVQDKELLEMQDMRQCLSMHQPWASLLVAGIKRHEGRVWYSAHRGRLWIASTGKEPRQEDIDEITTFYNTHYNTKFNFPAQYPVGCLLGCVNMDECLSQEEYRESYPNGESESPYVFICSNPQKLPVLFPIKGQRKIYEIQPRIHVAACKTLALTNPTKTTKAE